MRLFVLGATGRIGTHILDLARSRGHHVTAFVRSPEKLTPTDSLTIVGGDPRRPESIAGALRDHDAVLSAIGPPPRRLASISRSSRNRRHRQFTSDQLDGGSMQAQPPNRIGDGLTLHGVVDAMEVIGRHARHIGQTGQVERVVQVFGKPSENAFQTHRVVTASGSFVHWKRF